MVSIRQQFDNDDHYVGGNVPYYIVVHGTGNQTDSASGNANYFCGGDRESSAHYFVDDKEIVQLVRDTDGAWHCGDGNGRFGITNKNSIGIEMCCTNYVYSAQTQANTIDLIRVLMAKYKIPLERVVRHYDASRKNCPSGFSANNWSAWFAFKQKLAQPLIPEKQFNIHMIANVQNIGLQNVTGVNDATIGTVGKGLRMESIEIDIDNGVSITVDAHVQNLGTMQGQAEGQMQGTIGQALRLEAVIIHVKEIPQGYKLQYQAHVENVGWMPWVESGQIAGTEGKSLRMEALRVRIVKA